MAFSGKYLSPVLEDGLPDLVVHFWSPQSLRDFCGAFNLGNLRQQPCTSWLQAALSSRSTALRPCLELQQT